MPALQWVLRLAVACVAGASTMASASQDKPAPADLNRLVAERGGESRLRDGVLHLRKTTSGRGADIAFASLR
jgi:hypothetical protein